MSYFRLHKHWSICQYNCQFKVNLECHTIYVTNIIFINSTAILFNDFEQVAAILSQTFSITYPCSLIVKNDIFIDLQKVKQLWILISMN